MFPNFSSKSAKLYERACKVMPGGNTRTSLFWPPYQVYGVSGSGARIVDADGIERIDFNNNFTALIHGHSHPLIVERVRDQLNRLTSVGLTTEAEIKLAELLCARVRTFERIRFANSGTEATMNAIKAARGFTGRPKFAKCEGGYHGTYESFEISIASTPDNWGDRQKPTSIPDSRGTPQGVIDDVVIIPFNDPQGAEAILIEHADQLAAVMIDPMPVRIGMIPATPEFLEMVRNFTQRTGSLLVFDEVLNFRLDYHGAQHEFNVEPDLTALGKVIGGGFPVGAIAGKEEIMAVFDPREGHAVWHGGTFNGNPIVMVAGHAAMELMTPEAFERLNTLGELMREKIGEAFRQAYVPWQVTGLGSLFRIHPSNRRLTDYRSYYQEPALKQQIEWLMVYLLNHGILMTRAGVGSLSTAIGEAEIEQFAETLLNGLSAMKKEGTI
jgi:glutamate-1-semialdehyde 2,1-aminomutase